MKSGLVSVIVPIYNPEEKMLRECLNSIESQTYDEIEIIVVDDSPSSKNDELVKSILDKGYTFLNNSENLGISASRNKGVEESEGEFFTILDQDDYLDDQKIEKQVNIMRENPNIGMVITNLYHLNNKTGDTRERDYNLKLQDMTEKEIAEYFFRSYKQEKFNPPLTTEMIRRKAFDKTQGYDEDLYGMNDREMVIQLIDKGYDIHLISEPLHYRRYHEENASKSGRNMLKDQKLMTDKILEKYPELSKLERERRGKIKFKEVRRDFQDRKLLDFTKNYLATLIIYPPIALKNTKNYFRKFLT